MKTICLYFQVRQPLRLKKYRFFNMGKDHNYLDDISNRSIVQRTALRCYLPMNELLLKLIQEHKGAFKVTFSMSGLTIEQFRQYAPEVLDGFRKLAATECVEFLGETYSHSLSSLISKEEFELDVKRHCDIIDQEFGKVPTAFRNTELIYSDQIGEWVAGLGFKAMLTEGAKHVLGWKSPNFLYANSLNQRLKLLLRNNKLSDDLTLRFSDRSWSEWPLTADKYVKWIAAGQDVNDEICNIFVDYETFGETHIADSGIFDFVKHLPKAAIKSKLNFATATETAHKYQPIAVLHCPHPMSWTDEERDVTAWIGNELQKEAFNKLYAQRDKVKAINDESLTYVWDFLQTSDHFYYMATKWFSSSSSRGYINPYGSAYEAFINYMNILSDFIIVLDKRYAEIKEYAVEV